MTPNLIINLDIEPITLMKNPFNPKSQNYRILERLREGPATNAALF